MENKDSEKEIDQKTPTLWKWYFGWNLWSFLTIPIFLLLVSQGLWLILLGLKDVIPFFPKPITLGSILVTLISRNFLFYFPLLLIPIAICFFSIGWLYQVNIKNNLTWKKVLYSIGIILLGALGTSFIRAFFSVFVFMQEGL